MRIDRRLEKLERIHNTEPTILYFDDGQMATIKGGRDYLLRLFNRAATGAQTPRDQKDLDLIRRSVDASECDGRMVELVRCFQLGPVQAVEQESA